MVTLTLLRQDLRLLVRERTVVIMLALALAAVFHAAWSGSGWHARQLTDYQAAQAESTAATGRETALLAELAAGSLPPGGAGGTGLPNTVRTEYLRPPGPLAGLAIGDAELRPARATITALGRADDLFRFYQVDNPALLALGRFDLAFVIVYLLPLLILGMSYSVLSADRESGSLVLLLSQPLSAARVAWTRIALRTGLVAVAVVLGGLLAWLLFTPRPLAPQAGARMLLWSTVTLAYCAFWGGITAFVAARNGSSDRNALALLLCWATVTLLLPASVALMAETVSPTPSRLHYITTARAAENQANAQGGELLQGYLLDHPELEITSDSVVAPFIKTFVLVQQQVEAAVAPVTARFEERLARQQQFAASMAWLSPASLTQRALAEAAGSGLARQRRFEQEARELRVAWLVQLEAPLIAGRRLTADEFTALPRPSFSETPLVTATSATLPPALGLFAYALLVVLGAQRRFHGFPAVAADPA